MSPKRSSSNDSEFEKNFWDVIGLYLDPPATALVLCCQRSWFVSRTRPCSLRLKTFN
jgi:hypothetical protein